MMVMGMKQLGPKITGSEETISLHDDFMEQ